MMRLIRFRPSSSVHALSDLLKITWSASAVCSLRSSRMRSTGEAERRVRAEAAVTTNPDRRRDLLLQADRHAGKAADLVKTQNKRYHAGWAVNVRESGQYGGIGRVYWHRSWLGHHRWSG